MAVCALVTCTFFFLQRMFIYLYCICVSILAYLLSSHYYDMIYRDVSLLVVCTVVMSCTCFVLIACCLALLFGVSVNHHWQGSFAGLPCITTILVLNSV